jgi:hypothetical protein
LQPGTTYGGSEGLRKTSREPIGFSTLQPSVAEETDESTLDMERI